jgi:hypothetical protein
MITNLKENDVILCVVPYTVYADRDLFLQPLKIKEIVSVPHDSYIKEFVVESVKLFHNPLYGHCDEIETYHLPFSHVQDYFKKLNLEEIL